MSDSVEKILELIESDPQLKKLRDSIGKSPAGMDLLIATLIRSDHEVATSILHEMSGSGDFTIRPFHQVLFDTLDRCLAGELGTRNLIINMPPGTGKSALCGWILIARCFAINPNARILYLSQSEDLVKDISGKAKDLVSHPDYLRLFPQVRLGAETAKLHWKTTAQGEVKASSTGGSVTGFRAGRLASALRKGAEKDPVKIAHGYQGHILCDDMTKPDDIGSPLRRRRVHTRMTTVVQSRLQGNAMFIVIEQRTHPDDLSSFLLGGGMGVKWAHLAIPALVEEPVPYPTKYTHGIPIEHGLEPGSIWEDNPSFSEVALAARKEADPITYYAQYQQDPKISDNNLIDVSQFKTYDKIPPDLEGYSVFVDTASKTNAYNDYTAMAFFGYATDVVTSQPTIYLLDISRYKVEFNQLVPVVEAFINKHTTIRSAAQGIDRPTGLTTYIEEAGTGQALMHILAERGYRVAPVEKHKAPAKRDQCLMALQAIRTGRFFIPAIYQKPSEANGFIGSGQALRDITRTEDWYDAYLQELEDFTEDGTHNRDDQCDVTFFGINAAPDRAKRYGVF